eukprot:1726688-Pleurochrysis_carterae.AAC.1
MMCSVAFTACAHAGLSSRCTFSPYTAVASHMPQRFAISATPPASRSAAVERRRATSASARAAFICPAGMILPGSMDGGTSCSGLTRRPSLRRV